MGSAGAIEPTANRHSGRTGPRNGAGSMAVITDAHAWRGWPARINRASSACSSRPDAPSRYAAEMTTSRRTRSGLSTASCSATDPPVLVPPRNTGSPRSRSIALANSPRSATSTRLVQPRPTDRLIGAKAYYVNVNTQTFPGGEGPEHLK